MKWRNQLIALCCLAVFVAVGVLYFRTWVVQKPFAIVLFVCDGMNPRHLTAARLYESGADHRLTVEKFPHLALLTTHSNDFAVPDLPAAASTLATGRKVNNGSLALAPDGTRLTSILEAARRAGRIAGLVTNGRLCAPGAAAFYAHAASADDLGTIGAQFLDEAGFDVALGGGAHDLTPESKGGRRKDGRDLLLEMKTRGLNVLRNRAELEAAATFHTGPIIGLFANGELDYAGGPETPQPSLADMVRRSIEFLQFNVRGYLLVVEVESVTRAAQANDAEHLLRETLEFDRAVATAIRYAGEKALIVAVGRQAIGGVTLNGFPLRQDRGAALLGINAYGYPALTWASGPHGAKPEPSPAAADAQNPAAFYAPAAIPTAEDVLAAGLGIGSEELRGFRDNTAIFSLLNRQL